MIKYKLGDVTNPEVTKPTIIVHCCNDIGVMGGGVAAALRNKWPRVYVQYENWYHAHKGFGRKQLVLGQVQYVAVETNLWVCNLIGQRDVQSYEGLPPIRYEAIREGLRRISTFLKESNKTFEIVMPRIGAGLAGGEWGKISAIVNEELKDLDVVVYDNIPVEGTYYEGTWFYWNEANGDKLKYPTSRVKPAEQLEFGGQSKP